MKRKSKHNVNVTLLIFFMCTLVVFTTLWSYVQYTKKLNVKLMQLAESNLSSGSETAIQHFHSKLDSIYVSLENISIPLVSGKVEPTSFPFSLNPQSSKGNLGSLQYFSLDYITKFMEESERSKLLDSPHGMYIDKQPSGSVCSITISLLLKKNDSVLGSLCSTYNPKRASSVFLETLDNQTASIIDSNGNILMTKYNFNADNYVRYLKEADFYSGSSISQFKKNLLSRNSGIIHYNHKGKNVYAYYQHTGIEDFYSINIMDAAEIESLTKSFFSLTNSFFENIVLIILIFICFIIFLQIINNKNIEKNHQRLLLEKERYQTVLNHSQAALWEYRIASCTMIQSDPDLGIYTGLSEITDYESHMVTNEIIHPDDMDIFKHFCNSLKSGLSEISAEFRATDITGSYVWFELTGTTLFDNNGKPLSVIGQSTNVNTKKQELETLRDHANRDPLTKLFNRSALVSKINEYLSSDTTQKLHAFFMIDIDNFKGINDTFGHTFGDAVLIDLSSHLNKYFKEPHIIGRLGGDEFVVFLWDIPSLEYAEDQAKKISRLFRKIYSGIEEHHYISGSIGISFYPEHADSFKSLMEKADIALYHSKNLGKDCYSFYSKEMDATAILPETGLEPLDPGIELDSCSLIDSSLFAKTIDLLFDVKNRENSIQVILSLIGNYFELDCLYITEYIKDTPESTITFQWSADSSYYINKELDQDYARFKDTPNGVFYTSNLENPYFLKPSNTNGLHTPPVNGMFQCGIANGNEYIGYMSALIYEQNRLWSKASIDSLTLLSKIIGSYVLNLRIQQKAEQIAQRDSLTGAYNIIFFTKEAERIVSKNSKENYAVIYFDINKFKFFNDNYGYSEGDRILVEFTKILNKATQSDEIFGRVNGDKFIALYKYHGTASFTKRLKKLNKQFNSIKKTETDYYKLSIAIGIYPITGFDYMSANIDKANIARKHIKEYHKTTYSYFDESMKSTLKKQKEIEDIMEDALQNHQFEVFYQPKINLSTNSVCGAEALVRWNQPGVGLVPPIEFIPIFEENGFIEDLDFYVFEQVCQHLRQLLDHSKKVVPISVNFSRVHLKNRNLPNRLKKIVSNYNLPTKLIEIEITESAFVDDNEFLVTILNSLHSIGFKLSMDDFGTGLSSLNSLRKLPFDVLKLDKDFFQNSSATNRERVVITNIVKMANELHMEIVSEGVETKEQADFLSEINCPIAQGYLFARPMPAKDFEDRYC